MTAATPFQTKLPAESPKWTAPLSKDVQSLYDDTNSRFVVPKKVTAFLADIAKGSELINSIAKVFKNVATYHEAVTSDLTSKGIISQLGFFSDVIKTFGFFKGIHAILEKALEVDVEGSKLHQRNLGIASGVFQTIVGGTAGAKILNTLKLIDLAAFSSAIGSAAVFPFTVFSNSLDLVKNIVDLTLNSMKVDDANTKIDAAEDNLAATKIMHEKIDPTKPPNKKLDNLVQAKQAQATNPSVVLPDVFGNLDAFFTSHLQKMKDKQDAAHTKLTALETDVGTTSGSAATALQEYQNASVAKKAANAADDFWDKLKCNWNKRSARTALVNAKLAHDKACERRDQLKEKFIRRIGKHTVWTRAQQMFAAEIKDSSGAVIKSSKELAYTQDPSGNYRLDAANPVNQLLTAERKKWAARDTFWGQDKLKGGIAIFINCTVIVCLIASIVLSFTGIGILALSLTLTSLWLLVSFAGIANSIVAKYIEEQRKEKPALIDYKKISPALLS